MKPEKWHLGWSVKRLRQILGNDDKPMTQKVFAAMVGVSVVLIKKVETGEAPVTLKLEKKIQTATGAVFRWPNFTKEHGMVRELLGGGEIAHITPGIKMGFGYNKQAFDYHRQFFRTDPKAADVAIDEALPMLKALFAAAAKSGTAGLKNRLPALRASLLEWMFEQNKLLRLGVKLQQPSASAQSSPRSRRPSASH